MTLPRRFTYAAQTTFGLNTLAHTTQVINTSEKRARSVAGTNLGRLLGRKVQLPPETLTLVSEDPL